MGCAAELLMWRYLFNSVPVCLENSEEHLGLSKDFLILPH